MRVLLLVSALALSASLQPRTPLWVEAPGLLGDTSGWTNKVEVADLDGDERPDLLFANGGDYSTPGTPELNGAYLNQGAGRPFADRSRQVFGATPDLARVIKARDLSGDGRVDILVGTTYQTQSRLYLNDGGGAFREVTATHLPQVPLSVGDLEFGDVDADGDLDVVLADWGPGNNMTNDGGRTRLWINQGGGRFMDATASHMPATLVRFSWDVEFIDVDNDLDLDIAVSCKRCIAGLLLRNDGTGHFAPDPQGLPQYTNNYEYEAMDLDGDGFLDLITINDGEIVGERNDNRREHVLRNDGKGRFRDATAQWWPADANIGEDDNMVAFLDVDSDGDADFVIGSLSGPDRLILNDGRGHLSLRRDVFAGSETPGTLGLALADLDGDRRLDVIQSQGEHPTAVQERVFLGTGLAPDSAAPVVSVVTVTSTPGSASARVRARVHDRKSPSLPTEWRDVVVESNSGSGVVRTVMHWYGEYLWAADVPAAAGAVTRVCATDAAGLRTCQAPTR